MLRQQCMAACGHNVLFGGVKTHDTGQVASACHAARLAYNAAFVLYADMQFLQYMQAASSQMLLQTVSSPTSGFWAHDLHRMQRHQVVISCSQFVVGWWGHEDRCIVMLISY